MASAIITLPDRWFRAYPIARSNVPLTSRGDCPGTGQASRQTTLDTLQQAPFSSRPHLNPDLKNNVFSRDSSLFHSSI